MARLGSKAVIDPIGQSMKTTPFQGESISPLIMFLISGIFMAGVSHGKGARGGGDSEERTYPGDSERDG